MAAGFQGYIGGAACQGDTASPGVGNGLHFRMAFTCLGMKALRNRHAIAHKHTTHARVRRGAVLSLPGQVQRMLHPVFVGG